MNAKWYATVREMPHVKGFSYPVFEWSYGIGGMRGGEVRVWSLQRKLSFIDRREGDEEMTDAQGALDFVERMCWPAPPHFLEVFDALHAMPEPHNQEEAEKGFADLKKRWEKLT